MIEGARLDAKLAIAEHGSCGRPVSVRTARTKGIHGAEAGPLAERSVAKFGDGDREVDRGVAKQVPVISRELGRDAFGQPRRTNHPQQAGPVELSPQQLIEPGEMVHVPVADEDVSDAQQFA